MANFIPREVKHEIVTGWLAETWKVGLLINTYTPDPTHTVWADVSAHQVVGTGYTTGGASVSKLAWGAGSGWVDTNNVFLDATDVQWTTATLANVQYLVVYETSGNKIRFVYDLNTTYSVTAGTFTIQWNAGGLVKISS